MEPTTSATAHELQVARRIRVARRLAGLTQEQAARKLGTTVRTWARWERCETTGFLGELDRIAKALGVSRGELSGESPNGREATLASLEAKVDAVLASLEELKASLR